jgi:hypothetical protein
MSDRQQPTEFSMSAPHIVIRNYFTTERNVIEYLTGGTTLGNVTWSSDKALAKKVNAATAFTWSSKLNKLIAQDGYTSPWRVTAVEARS